jgi:hypothetical protein
LDSTSRADRPRHIPDGMSSECKDLAETIRMDRESLRYDKIQAARMRISSGFYDSGHVLSRVASRLLEEGTLG